MRQKETHREARDTRIMMRAMLIVFIVFLGVTVFPLFLGGTSHEPKTPAPPPQPPKYVGRIIHLDELPRPDLPSPDESCLHGSNPRPSPRADRYVWDPCSRDKVRPASMRLPGIRLARPLNLTWVMDQLEYPAEAKKQGIEGVVELRVLVDERGSYSDYKILKSDHPAFLEEVLEEVPKLRFSPAANGATPMRCWIFIPFRFQLKKDA